MIWARVGNNEPVERNDKKHQPAERCLIGQCRNRSYGAAPPQKPSRLHDGSKRRKE
jgi:hypothetical protein